MAKYKATQMKNGLWYPRAIVSKKSVDTDQVAKKLAEMSTVTHGDVYAVLKNLPTVMSDLMAAGRSVYLEGIGHFRLIGTCDHTGVETEEEVSAKQFSSIRIRFVPESKRTSGSSTATRSLVSDDLFWEKVSTSTTASSSSSSDSDTDSGDSDEEEVNPFG